MSLHEMSLQGHLALDQPVLVHPTQQACMPGCYAEDAKDNEEEPEAKQSPKGQSPKGTKRGTGSTPSKAPTSSPQKRTRSAASSPDKKPASFAKKRTK